MRQQIPNFFTVCNLVSGIFATYFIITGGNNFIYSIMTGHEYLPGEALNNFELGIYLIFIGGLFDFFDGFIARLLKTESKIGKQLDSFSDFISFGVSPGFLIFYLILFTSMEIDPPSEMPILLLAYSAIMIPVFSAIRLAKFNLNEIQKNTFQGMPVPASAFFIASLYFAIEVTLLDSSTILTILFSSIVILSYLMISPLKVFSLKFKNYKWENNKIRYLFLITSLLLFLKFYFASITIIVLLHLFLSLMNNILKNEV